VQLKPTQHSPTLLTDTHFAVSCMVITNNLPVQSELPFRMLCRSYGAQAAYTPMFHARLFLQHQYYRCGHRDACYTVIC
jgi:hypothetical protein